MAKKKAATKPETVRYRKVSALLTAARAWCEAEASKRKWDFRKRSKVAGLTDLVSKTSARDMHYRLFSVLQEARAFIAAEDARWLVAPKPKAGDKPEVDDHYTTQIRETLSRLPAWLPKGDAHDMVFRTMFIQALDQPTRSNLSNRALAVLAILEGSGKGWALLQMNRARESCVATHWPSVLDFVRAEERAISAARKRVQRDVEKARARARERRARTE